VGVADRSKKLTFALGIVSNFGSFRIMLCASLPTRPAYPPSFAAAGRLAQR
jgi:hypothetical protein